MKLHSLALLRAIAGLANTACAQGRGVDYFLTGNTAGGDQSECLRLWKGTPLQMALVAALARKMPLGGTRAGLAVLGEVDYSGANGSVTSAHALADPCDRDMTLDRGFITAPGLSGTVTDSHFRQHDRMGRFITFVARNVPDGVVPLAAARGIAVDEATALVVDNGVATRLGSGAAYFVQPTAAPVVCVRRKPLSFRNVSVDRLGPGGGSFDLQRWAGSGTVRYDVSAEGGQLTSTQAGGSIY